MSTYVWYNKYSKESGEVLAGLLNSATHGTLPPADFSGALVFFGGKPSAKFKWEGRRNIQAVFNDPRENTYVNRADIFARLANIGRTPLVHVPNEDSNYVGVGNTVGGGGFTMCKPSGASARTVSNQAEYAEAMVAGCSLALEAVYSSINRCRLFVVNGKVVAALQRDTENTEHFLARALNSEMTTSIRATLETTLRGLLDDGTIKAGKSYWNTLGTPTVSRIAAAETAATSLGMDFCAVDFALDETPGLPLILNVVTAPALMGFPAVAQAVATGITVWLTDNSKTALQVLQEIASSVNEEEAAAILSELKSHKERLTRQFSTDA